MTTERLPDSWHSLEYPVLVEAARDLHAGQRLNKREIATRVGRSEQEVRRAITALLDAGYLIEAPIMTDQRGRPVGIMGNETRLTERGRRAVGLWPSGDDVDALLDALRQAEDATTDPEDRSALRKAAGALLSVPKDVMVDVLAAYLARQTGLG